MSAIWPTAIATDADLYLAKNSLQTTLATALGTGDVSVVLASSTGFPTAGAVTIDNEVIFYTGISGATLTGCTRGADGTTAATHSVGVPVGASIVAFHHNGLVAEVEAIETYLSANLGTGATPLTASRALASNSSKKIVASSVTDTELGYLSGVTSAIQTQFSGKASTDLSNVASVSANVPMNSKKLTGLAAATVNGDALRFEQLKVVQIVSASTTTEVTETAGTYTDTTLTASITPTSSSNKIMVIIMQSSRSSIGATKSAAIGALKLLRGSTNILENDRAWGISANVTGFGSAFFMGSFNTVDAPATTSSTTYKTQFKISASGDGSVTVQPGGGVNQPSTILLLEVVA